MPTSNVLAVAANAAWKIAQPINRMVPEGQLPKPKWAPAPLMTRTRRKQFERGVPRKTLSLCPDCNREALQAVLYAKDQLAEFRDNPGIVEAEIIEECGRVLMRKTCGKHGPFEDALSNHPDLFRRMEHLAFGRDFDCVGDQDVHDHGASSIKSGRGSYLIVDLTNRCNMMCSPCFMDANAANYVHELNMNDVRFLFENALSVEPQREINVLFSGGEPTLSPIFLVAVRHAKGMGFHRLHVATNGARFAQNPEFAQQAKEAGLHAVYLQCDGVSEEKSKHRGLGNYVETRQKALENIAAAGMRTTLQVTVVNGQNNDGIGDLVAFATRNIDKIHGIIFQPIMFTGRDEGIPAEERYVRRYPVTQLAFDLQEQTSIGWQPMRDWFPASDYGVFAHLCDVLNPKAELGSLFPDIHPNHGIFSPLLVDTQDKTAVPICAFFNLERFMQDVVQISDSGRRPAVTKSLVLLSASRNFDERKAPSGFGRAELVGLLRDCFYRVAGNGEHWSSEAYSYAGRWRLMMVNGMLFQDLYNYDLSTISNSATPVATQEGEIGFCAYNAAGWRKVVEHLHRTATLADWHRKHGRHEIYANGKELQLGRQPRNGETEFVQIER